MTRVERLWPGSTIVCVGSGPSLTVDQLEVCRGKARMIVVNDAYRLATWADVLYACDAKWWRWEKNKSARAFAGLKYTLKPSYPEIQVLRNLGRTGLSLDPTGLKTGFDSGYQAINLAVLLGATRILLLGYDMRKIGPKAHFFGNHPDNTAPPFLVCLKDYGTLVGPLREAGVSVINCTPGSALTVFPMGTLAEQLTEVAA